MTAGRTNCDPVALADVARPQAYYLGPDGFLAMRAKPMSVFASTETSVSSFVEENCDDSVSTERRITGKKHS